MKGNRTKTAAINLRVRPEYKAQAEANAAAENRSVAAYIEVLISRDTDVKKIIVEARAKGVSL